MTGRRNELRVKPKVYNQRCVVLLQCLHPMMHWSEMEPRWCTQLGWEMADRWMGESGRNSDKRARWIFRSGGNGEPPEGFVQKKDNLICGLDRVIWQNVPGQLEEWTRDQGPTSLAQVSVCDLDYSGLCLVVNQSISKYC